MLECPNHDIVVEHSIALNGKPNSTNHGRLYGIIPIMPKYEFTLILQGSHDLTEGIADHLFEAGCDDGSPGTHDGEFSIDFHRTANSLEAAINSAMANVKSASYEVDRVEIEAGAIPQVT